MTQLAHGVYPVLPTPFLDDGQIDEQSFRNVIRHVLDQGAEGVVFPGVASEYTELTADERLALTKIVGEEVGDRAAYVVGASVLAAADAVQFVVAGEQAGASCAMVMTPSQFAGDITAIVAFYNDVHDSTGLDLMLQNAPIPAGSDLSVADVIAITQQSPGIRYVKDETAPHGQRIERINAIGSGFLQGVFGGAGGRYVIDELNRGSMGTMPACELVAIHVDLLAAHADGQIEKARNLFEQMLPTLNMQSVYRWSLTKEILFRRGLLRSTFVRASGPRLDDTDKEEVTALLRRLGDLIEPCSAMHEA